MSTDHNPPPILVLTERQTSQCHSPAAPCTDPPPRRPSFTRSGSVRYHDSEVSPESTDKPSGKRKFKSKHLCDNGDQKVQLFTFICGCLKACTVLYQFIDLLCPPVVRKMLYFSHTVFVGICFYSTQVCLKRAVFCMSSTQRSDQQIYILDEQTQQLGQARCLRGSGR